MPYKDIEQQRKYQREWVAKRRAEFFKNKQCAQKDETCEGALELDHIDPAEKESHNIWSWSAERRAAEIAKCQVLCESHHCRKTIGDMDYGQVHGTKNSYDYYNCRCPSCVAIHNQTVNIWRWKTGRREPQDKEMATKLIEQAGGGTALQTPF